VFGGDTGLSNEDCRLPVGTSAEKSELVALTCTLQLAAGVQLNIYTDSKYTFTTIHVHGPLHKERGLINLGGKGIKYGQEILELLDVVWAPKWWQLYTAKGTKMEMQ
jgi:hypothetical protein